MVGTRGKKIDIVALLRSTDKESTPKKSPIKSRPRKSIPDCDHKKLPSPGQKRKLISSTISGFTVKNVFKSPTKLLSPSEENAKIVGQDETKKVSVSGSEIKTGLAGKTSAKRGRPRKFPHQVNKSSTTVRQDEIDRTEKPSHDIPTPNGTSLSEADQRSDLVKISPRKRGRPRKIISQDDEHHTAPIAIRQDTKDRLGKSLDEGENTTEAKTMASDDGEDLSTSRASGEITDTRMLSGSSGKMSVEKVVIDIMQHTDTVSCKKRPASPLVSDLPKNSKSSDINSPLGESDYSMCSSTKKHMVRELPELSLRWSKDSRKSELVKPDEGKALEDENVSCDTIIDETVTVACSEDKTSEDVLDLIPVTQDTPDTDTMALNESGQLIVIKPSEAENEVYQDIIDGVEADVENQVILIVPADIADDQVEQFIADNMAGIPQSYIVKSMKREPVNTDVENMNSLDVLVQLAVEDGQMQDGESEPSGSNVFDQMPVHFPHVSIKSGPIDLKICGLPECMCTYYHCLLCRPELVGAFSKSVMRIHYDYHRKKGTQYGDYDIYICQLKCRQEPHLHCPLCSDTVEFINKSVSVFLSHLAGCLDMERNKHQNNMLKMLDDKNIDEIGCSTNVVQPRSSILVPHPSIIRIDEQLQEERCTPNNGCNCEFTHCPLCSMDKHQFKYECKAVKHFEFHMNHSVEFNGYRILICLLSCCVYSHYHCPLCGSTFQRKCDIKTHVTKRCKGPARKRKRKTCMINPALVKMYSGGENYSTSYLKRINADESRDILAMFDGNTRTLDPGQIRYPHLSIIHKDTTIHPTHCQASKHRCACNHPYCLLCAEGERCKDCNCLNFHCILCPNSKLTSNKIQRARDHIHSHYKKGIPFKDHVVLSCGMLKCVPEKRHGYHYHCPQCGIITFLSECFRRHLYSGCQVKDTFFRFVERADEKNVHENGKVLSADGSPVEFSLLDTDDSSTLIHVKQEMVETNTSGNEATKVKGTSSRKLITLKNLKQERSFDDVMMPSTPAREMDIDRALPSTPNHLAATKRAGKTAQVLQCVSADLQESLLQQASPSTPESLLKMLEAHAGISSQSYSDNGVYRVQGSWDMLEKASSIILQLIENKFTTEEQVLEYIKENTKVNVIPTQEPGMEQELYEAYPVDEGGNDESFIPETKPVVESAYWEEVQNLDKYLVNRNLNIPVRCAHCKKKLASMNNLIIHWKSKQLCLEGLDIENLPKSYGDIKEAITTIREPACPDCSKKFVSIVSCISHYVRSVCRRDDHHERMVTFGIFKDSVSSVYCCSKCPYTSMGKRHTVSHYEKMHMPKLFPCQQNECKMEFATQQALDHHIDIIHVNPTYNKVPCELCGVPLKRSSVAYHMVSKHSDVTKLPQLDCTQCDFSSWSITNLRLHVINKHKTKHYNCEECGKSFGQMNKLTQHINFVHKKICRYLSNSERTMAQCAVCNAVMIKKNLKRHMETVHTKETKYPCHGCDKIFYNKKLRWMHNLSHLTNANNERIYLFKCSVCKKGFNRRWWYLEHIQNAHTEKKPFECRQCGKSFRFKILLQKHMLTHDNHGGECKICNNIFTSVRALRIHMATRHSTKGLVTCPCNLQFYSLQAYRDHIPICTANVPDLTKANMKEELQLVSNAGSEELLSDGVQYETRIIEISGALSDQLDSGTQNITFEHLEAAHTLESISVNAPEQEVENVITIDSGHSLDKHSGHAISIDSNSALKQASQQVIVYTEDGNIISLDSSNIHEVLDEELQTSAEVVEETKPESQTLVMETDEHGRVFLKTADGLLLSEEESQQILLEMNASQADGEAVIMGTNEVTIDTGKASDNNETVDDLAEGYMCGACSVVLSSLDDMEQHITEVHVN